MQNQRTKNLRRDFSLRAQAIMTILYETESETKIRYLPTLNIKAFQIISQFKPMFVWFFVENNNKTN